MLKSTSWVWVACVGLVGALAATGNDPAPAPKPVAENWLPMPKPREPKDHTDPVEVAPPSAFPGLVLPEPLFEATYEAAFKKMCARLTGTIVLKIDSTDGVLQRVLKARLQQGVLEYRQHIKPIAITGPEPRFMPISVCLKDMQAAALELWAGQPKELIPWLEELVVAAKYEERYIRLRAEVGALLPQHLNVVTRHRLKLETELWKAKNADARRGADPPTKKDDAKAKPAEGEWLGDKKLPPSLFPDLGLPAINKNDPKWAQTRAAQFAKSCPHLSGKTGLKIEAADSTPQKLLKARLHQGTLEIQRYRADAADNGPREDDLVLRCDCQDDMLAAALELWSKQPKELVPWVEELLIDAKDFERWIALRVEVGALRPVQLNQISRHRLKIEAELWKAKNLK